MPVVAVVNQKGGVGKTTVALGLAEALAGLGHQVTVVDLDPSHAATDVLGVDTADVSTVYDLLAQRSAGLSAAVMPTTWGFDLVPGDSQLEARTWDPSAPQYELADAIEAGAPGGWVLLDCPPSLTLPTTNALTAADAALLVVEAEFKAMRAAGRFLQSYQQVRRRLNPRLELVGVLVNKWRKTIEEAAYVDQLDNDFPGLVWRPFVPLTVAVPASAASGEPLSRLQRRGAVGLASLFELHARTLLACMHATPEEVA
jgi:chromosome partitioning protein